MAFNSSSILACSNCTLRYSAALQKLTDANERKRVADENKKNLQIV